jgi:hypothetical protein
MISAEGALAAPSVFPILAVKVPVDTLEAHFSQVTTSI